MWSIRVLSGSQKGKIFQLKAGANVIGRSSECDICIPDQGISKHHAQVEVRPDHFVITDVGSRNGTFVGGVQVRRKAIKAGERISLFDTMLEIVPSAKVQGQMVPTNTSQRGRPQIPQDIFSQAAASYQHSGNNALNFDQAQAVGFDPSGSQQADSEKHIEPKSLKEFVVKYVNDVILPGNYKLAEVFEFKHLVAIFCAVFVIVVTSLSTIPLTRILKHRIEKTSQQRAMGIARALAESNKASLASGLVTGINVNMANREPGVDKAYIVDNEGRILAPKALAQQYPEIPFIHSARRIGKEAVEQLDDGTIGALAPIALQNPETGITAPMAYAVVIYDMSALAVDDSKTISLFIQTLFIALVVGAIIFFFLFKLIEYPIVMLDSQISRTMSEGQGQLSINYRFDRLQSLIEKINTLIARGSSGSSFDAPGAYEHERSGEAYGLVQLIGFPAIAVDAQKLTVISVNPQFQDQISKAASWEGTSINDILDQALKLNLKDIVERTFSNPNSIANNELDIDSVPYDVSGQAVFGSKEVNYVIISFIPKVME